jgi:hypothetical protein
MLSQLSVKPFLPVRIVSRHALFPQTDPRAARASSLSGFQLLTYFQERISPPFAPPATPRLLAYLAVTAARIASRAFFHLPETAASSSPQPVENEPLNPLLFDVDRAGYKGCRASFAFAQYAKAANNKSCFLAASRMNGACVAAFL